MKSITTILKESFEGPLSPEDQATLDEWVNSSPERQAFLEEWNDTERVAEALQRMDQYDGAVIWQKIQERRTDRASVDPVTPVRRMPWLRRWIAVAAAITGGLLIGGYWLFIKPTNKEKPRVAQIPPPTDILAPATNRATLTLGNGQQVYLDSAGNGALARQGNAQVVKLASGQLAYKVETSTNRELLYNTLANPRGSQVVNLTLSDGTKVWLNAASSLRYPVVFTGEDRTVEISGEGYFEVAQNASQPFKVKKENTVIEVLGTSFNVNAYTNEPAIKVTLLSGKVQVENQSSKLMLQPAQQAIVAGSLERAGSVDTAAVMAWKNGRFAFRGTDLATVMRQFARWYDVEVSYAGNVPDLHFTGRIGRTLTLDQALKTLANIGIHYRIEPGNKLKILP